MNTLDVKQTAAAMRAALRASFPGAKISLRMSAGSAHGWMDATWTDGPTPAQVGAVLRPFQSSRFDAMDDSYRAIEQAGSVRYSCRGFNTHRAMSAEAAAHIVETINAADPTQPAILENGRVRGRAVGEEASNRLEVRGYGGNEAGEQVVDIDLAAHQIFTRTPFLG